MSMPAEETGNTDTPLKKPWDSAVLRLTAAAVLGLLAIMIFKSAVAAFIAIFIAMFCKTRQDFKVLVYAGLIAITLRSFLFEPFNIPSGSMKSNLLVGDYLFVSKYSYGYSRYSFPLGISFYDGRKFAYHKPERGDVVVFRLPTDPKIDYIKRVMGLPGDTIQVRDSTVYINGEPLPRKKLDTFTDDEDTKAPRSIERYVETLPEGKQITILQEHGKGFANNTGIYRVPEGHYFMMGDNRDNSRDSRFLDEVGYVPEENLVGKAQMIFMSVDSPARKMRFDRFFHFIH